MNLLLPLGLLGLLGVLALILIYIIKPNYQQKLISSTFIWKLSLKYRKKRVPVSTLRNILIFLCQLAALATCGFLMAKPVIPYETTLPKNEKVIIIDASASMRIAANGETRFERAVNEAKTLVDTALKEDDSAVSVIVADSSAHFITSLGRAEDIDSIHQSLDDLVSSDLQCGYGGMDIDGAALLAEEVLKRNSETEVILLTATNYIDKGQFTVVNVADEDDWNAAVLNCVPELDEYNRYQFPVDVGCYGRSKSVTVYCQLTGVNEKDLVLTAQKEEYFNDVDTEKTVLFTGDDFGSDTAITSYESATIYINEEDPFDLDNAYNVYGGTKQPLRIQYASSGANNFFGGILRTLRETKKGYWNIELKEVSPEKAPETQGFDFYIFEHSVPEYLPTDGVVLLIDPDSAPSGSGLRLGDKYRVSSDSTLSSGTAHAITKFMDPSRITISEYRRIIAHDGYEELMYYRGDPVLLVKNDAGGKVFVMAFECKMSSMAMVIDFPTMMLNLFNYFAPATLSQYSYEVGDTVTVNARGTDLTVDNGQGEKTVFTESTGTLLVNTPTNYTVTQTDMRGKTIIEQFQVRIPGNESNITKNVDSLPLMVVETTTESGFNDLLFWFALFMLVMLFAEWWLHSRENL